MSVAVLSKLLDPEEAIGIFLRNRDEEKIRTLFISFMAAEFRHETRLTPVTMESITYLTKRLLMVKLGLDEVRAVTLTGQIAQGAASLISERALQSGSGVARSA